VTHLAPGQPVTIEAHADQQLSESVGRRARVVKDMGAFIILDVDEVGIRACTADLIQPYPTEFSLAREAV
jgi:hypothetical protein